MFKKLCLFLAALFTILISCAGPIIINAHADTVLTIDKINADTGVTIKEDYLNYLFANVSDDNIKALSFSTTRDTTDYSVIYENNVLVITYLKGNSDTLPLYTFTLNGRGEAVDRVTRCHSISLDFNSNTLSALYADGSQVLFNNLPGIPFYNFETDFAEYQPTLLDLSVTFKPVLSGSISRSQTIDGKEYNSKTLDMIIRNNGTDAQFSMFIVDKGQNITFPASSIQNNQGFNGTAVYAYVSDEWSSFNAGLLGNSVYAPCAWHTIAAGFNQTYSIYWEQISLEANKEYDVVVYGCLNDNAVQTNTSSQWDMRPVYTVSSSLNDVQEVYRSTFSISDPAVFNPNFVDEGNSVHAWNPNTDNSSLFNVSKAYRDDNGNVVIKGQTNSTLGDTPFSSGWFDNGSQNINSVFREYFGFLNKAIVMFPPAISVLFGIGLSSIIVIAVIKLLVKG